MHLEKSFTHHHTDTANTKHFVFGPSWMKCETRNTKQYWCALETNLHIGHRASAASSRQKLLTQKEITEITVKRKINFVKKNIKIKRNSARFFGCFIWDSSCYFFFFSFFILLCIHTIKIWKEQKREKKNLLKSCSVNWWVCIHKIAKKCIPRIRRPPPIHTHTQPLGPPLIRVHFYIETIVKRDYSEVNVDGQP